MPLSVPKLARPTEIDPQVSRAARYLIDTFGRDALDHVERRIASLQGGDGVAGIAHWQEVARAVRKYTGVSDV